MARLLASSWTQDALVLLAISLVALTWFGGKDFLWTPDSNFPLNLQPSIQRYYEVWDFRTLPGTTDTRKLAFVVPWALVLGAWSGLSLPFSPVLYQREVLVGLIWGSMVSAYALFQVLGRQLGLESWQRRMGGLLAGFLYGFNFFSMLTIWSSLAFLMYGYAFLPLILGLILRGLQGGGSTRYAVVVAIIWTLLLSPAYVTPPVAVTDWASVLLVALVFLLLCRLPRKTFMKRMAFVAKVLAAWVAFNFFWLVALTDLAGGEFTKYAGSQNLFAWNAASLADAFRLAGYPGLTATYKGFPYFAWASWYASPWTLLAGFVPAGLAAFALAKRRSPGTLSIAALWLIASFLVKGPAPPFGALADSVFGGGILAVAYRSTYQRFMGYAALGIALLAPLGALESIAYLTRVARLFPTRVRIPRLSRRSQAAGACFAVALISAAYVAPLWTGSVYVNEGITPSYQVSLPPYWNDLASWLDAQVGDFSVLPFPYPVTTSITSLSIANGTDGLLGMYPLITLSHVPLAMGPGPGVDLATMLAGGTLRDSRALDVLNVRYVLVHRDADMAYLQDNNQWVMAPPTPLMASLNGTPGLVFSRFFGQIAVFENTQWQGSELLLFPSTADIPPSYAAFVWNGVSGRVYRWDATLNATERPAVEEVFGIPLAPVIALNATLEYFAVSRSDPPGPQESALPFWIERSPAGMPRELWFRMGLIANMTEVHLYASDRPLLNAEPYQVFPDFFDSFENGNFSQWSERLGTWATTTTLAVDGTASAVAGPGSSALGADWSVNSGVLEGWFRFDNTTAAHYPFVLKGRDGTVGYWAVVLPGGTWGYFNGSAYVSFPVHSVYAVGTWTELQLGFDLTSGRFWVSVDGTVLTPFGLPSTDTGGRVTADVVGFRIQNVGANATGRMWADAVRARPYAPGIGSLPVVNQTLLDLSPRALPYQFLPNSHTDIELSLSASPGANLLWLKSYAAGWTLTVNGATLPETSHFAALGYWNGWVLPQSGNVTITIFYAPQRLLTGAFAVSSVALIVGILVVAARPFWSLLRRRLGGRDAD